MISAVQFKTTAQMQAHPFFNLPFYMPKYCAAVAIVKILAPAAQTPVYLRNNIV